MNPFKTKHEQKRAAHLVGVFEDEVLALVQLAADIDDTAEDSPGVLHAQVDLAGELIGFELLGAQDDVTSRVLHVVPRHVPEDHSDADDSQTDMAECVHVKDDLVCIVVHLEPQSRFQVLHSLRLLTASKGHYIILVMPVFLNFLC